MLKKKWLLHLAIVVLIGVLIFSGAKIFRWVVENRKTDELVEKVNKSVSVDSSKDVFEEDRYVIDFEELKKINGDIIGWIKVEGTDIELAVVQGSDNSYYLTHSLDKSYSSAGWAFMDYRNRLDGSDKNVVIYGHNRRNSSIFGTLKNVLNSEWYENENNRFIHFVTEDGDMVYEVFSVYRIEVEDYYLQTQFGDGEFVNFVGNLKNRSVKDFGVDVGEDDSILTLSTCGDDSRYRIVLHALLRK